MLVDLAAPDIEGIYETQMSLEFRALMQLGCSCAVQRAEARKIAVMPARTQRDTFSLIQLEQRSRIHQPCLQNGRNLRKIFLYHHTIPSGKKSLWGLFVSPIYKAVVIVHNTVRTNLLKAMIM
jgi:DNA polymerase epsilon subunit 1